MKTSKRTSKRVTWASIIVVVSSTILLLMLLLWVNFMFSAQKFSQDIKEEIVFTVFVKQDAKPLAKKSFEKKVKNLTGVKEVRYVSKEDAAVEMKKNLGEDIIGILDFNPLFDAYDIRFKSSFVSIEGLETIENKLKKESIVQDIVYDKSILYGVTKNIGKISLIFIGVSVFLLIIAVVLIYNFIRLAVYSKRFSIRTMQLVGASSSFIQKPFLKQSIAIGIVSALLAIGLGYLTLEYINKQVPSFTFLSNINQFLLSASVIFVFGTLLFLVSSFFAVRKYLHAKLSELYL
ncbi:MAG: permease-like cell division protein FtsX [Flavobacteriales bacterium]|jgi:cell division transport system permease protein|nr:permease-like cell division protein FtsX [Flavobacteriales bacterium]